MHMTCRNCKYNFCWLCLGDYKHHFRETGNYLCSDMNDVRAAGRLDEETGLTKKQLEIEKADVFKIY